MIPFHKSALTGNEKTYLLDVLEKGFFKGDGSYTKKCHELLETMCKGSKALLTHSGTDSLELAALLCNLEPGDEVILPSYTFSSTANAFLLRGAKLVFVDIREDTLNLNEKLLEEKITKKTRAICPVHYAGVGCEMDAIMELADRYNLYVVEDAAQGVMASYRNRPLGTLGHFGAFSFHETKNYSSGEGGACIINSKEDWDRAEWIREKGTNRSQFLRGQTDKYTWVEMGSSFLPSELIAAFLYAQLEKRDEIFQKRMAIWNRYDQAFEQIEKAGVARRPIVPIHCQHNAHLFYLLTESPKARNTLMDHLKEQGIQTTFHYIPLHSSPLGERLQTHREELPITDQVSECLVRLPLFNDLQSEDQHTVIDAIHSFFGTHIPYH